MTEEEIKQGVLSEFLSMCAFPHPSHGEKPLADYLEQTLKGRGLRVERDGADNLLVHVPATAGLESAPLTVLQGHIDMVCAVAPGSGYDPATDPITAVVEGNILKTDGRSSLGADNNLGNAAALWLMGQNFPHGPLRLLLTTAEEVGLVGAARVDPSWLAGARYLINTDGFRVSDLVIGSAGGRREVYTRPLHTVPRTGAVAFRVSLSGFLGGHSGYDINKGRANPIKLMTLFLGELRDAMDYELADLRGGHGFNAIPMECSAVLTVDRDQAPRLAGAVHRLGQSIRALYGENDPGGRITLSETAPPERVWDKTCRDSVIDLAALLYTGVYALEDNGSGRVSASANLGRVWTEEGEVRVASFLRCALDFSEEILSFQNRRAARLTGFRCADEGYPGWPADKKNSLAKRMSRIGKRVTGRPMKITTVHVGLEPSVLGAKNPGMEMVSVGPDIFDPHSTEERADLTTLPAYVSLLRETLTELSRTR